MSDDGLCISYRSFSNEGVTCFVNAVMQLLLSSEHLRRAIIDIDASTSSAPINFCLEEVDLPNKLDIRVLGGEMSRLFQMIDSRRVNKLNQVFFCLHMHRILLL
jgi:hypothetical protein